MQIDAGISGRDLLRLAQSYDEQNSGMVTRPGNGKCMYGRVEGTKNASSVAAEGKTWTCMTCDEQSILSETSATANRDGKDEQIA